MAVPGGAARRWEGDHAEGGAGHRGQQVRRLRRPRRRVGGRGEQEEQGRTTAGARPREGASPALPRGASREPRSLCPRVPAAPDAGVRRPEPLSGPSRSVTRAGIKRDGGKASGSVAGVPLGSGTRALPTRTPPPPAGPCGPQCPALSVAATLCSGRRICAGLCAPDKFQHPGAVGRAGGGGRSCPPRTQLDTQTRS